MSLKVVFCLLGLVCLAAGASVSYENGEKQAVISSTDTIQDLVGKFLTPLIQAARVEGGSFGDQLRRVAFAFIPHARALVTLKGSTDLNYDTEAYLNGVDATERALEYTFKSFEGLDRDDWYGGEAVADGLKSVIDIAFQVSRSLFENDQNAEDRFKDVAAIEGQLFSSLDFLDNLFKAIPVGKTGLKSTYSDRH